MVHSNVAVLVIDVQRYYTDVTSPLVSYTDILYPGSTRYLRNRLNAIVIPNIESILASARSMSIPIIYIRLCGSRSDRSDLHQNFRAFDETALATAQMHVYPIASEPLSDVDLRIAPLPSDAVIDKTGYSAFHKTDLHQLLKARDISHLVITGLTTSQCVNSTARAAADYGYTTLMIEDAQADYDHRDHQAALFASEPITGRAISTSELLALLSTETDLL